METTGQGTATEREKERGVSTPIKLENLKKILNFYDYEDRDYIIKGFTELLGQRLQLIRY